MRTEDSDLYWKKIIKKPIADRTEKELELTLEAIWALERSDNGNSGFDEMFRKNPMRFESINRLRDVVVAKKMISEEDFNRYFIGLTDKYERICNKYSFLEWSVLCKR